MSRGKSAFNNVTSNIALQVILAISGLIIPRLILSAFGSTMNGLINSVSQFLTYMALVEAGIGDVAIATLYKPLAQRNGQEINAIVSEARRKYFLSGVWFTLLVVAFAFIYANAISNQMDPEFVFWVTLIIAAVNMIDFFVIGKYKVFLIANQKVYIINSVRMIATMVLTIGSCALLLSEKSVIYVKILAVLTHLSEALFIKFYVKRNYPEVDFCQPAKKNIIPQQLNSLMHQIASVIVYNTDLVVLTIFSGIDSLKEVSVYTVYAMVYSMINNIMISFMTGFDNLFGDMSARKEDEKLKRIFGAYEYWYLVILYTMFSCFMVLVIPFVKNYTRGILDVNYIRIEVGILFGIKGVLACLKNPHTLIIRARGHFKQTQKFVIMEAIVNIIISIALVSKYGIVGVLIGTIVSHVVADVGMIWYANRQLLGKTVWVSFKYNAINTIVVVGLVLAELPMINNIGGWGEWVIYGMAIFVFNILIITGINAVVDSRNFRFGMNILKNRFVR